MTVSFTAEAERRFEDEHEKLRVLVMPDGTVALWSIGENGKSSLAITLSIGLIRNIEQFATRAIKAMEAAKTEVGSG